MHAVYYVLDRNVLPWNLSSRLPFQIATPSNSPTPGYNQTMSASVHSSIEAVFRIERARLVAGLTRMVRDIGQAEDLAQEALIAALTDWPQHGVPERPGAWLMATAKRRAIDQFRRRRMIALKHLEIGALQDAADEQVAERADARLDDEVGDELLSLMFVSCHPVLGREARAALTLRVVGGLTVEEIARAFLQSVPTIAQRIVRAKRALADSGSAYEVPRGAERAARLGSVLEVVYLIFNEGYAATSGEELIRRPLAEEAMRLGRILVRLVPDDPEVLGLLALMELNASRFGARVAPDGLPIPITEQNRGKWDRTLITRGLAGLAEAMRRGGLAGPYRLQAAIVACHARALRAEDTDWREIAALYGMLFAMTQSPVVALNGAVATGMAEGPAAGLKALAALDRGVLDGFAPFHAAQGEMLDRSGARAEAALAFARAAELSSNAGERAFLERRAREMKGGA
jgi:RNA polymerase sigma factor (sigma-70 family)